MSLETPNRMVASGVLLVDSLLPAGEQQVFRSSNGILRKVSEVQPEDTISVGDYELETPVTNDEGIVLMQLTQFAGPNTLLGSLIGWIAPLPYVAGTPEFDDIEKNHLALLATVNAVGAKLRFGVAVFGLATTVAPIEGEPLPPPGP